MSASYRTMLVLCPFLFVSFPVHPQTRDRAELGGRVTDETGGILPGVALQLRNEATAHQHNTLSGETGDFTFPFVSPGSYTLTAELPGFSRLKIEGIRLTLNQKVDLPVVMKVGTPTTVLTVIAEANRIEATSPTVNDAITETELRDMPILTGVQGRSVLTQLPLLVTGASAYRPVGVSDSYGIGVSINGSPVGGIGFYLDGVDNSYLLGNVGGSATVGPNPDALEEFSVLTQTYRAEAGGHQAQVHWKTKGGSNRFHGQARVINLNPDLSARDFFDTARKSLWTTNALGFQLSGPVRLPGLYDGRSKTLFLFDYENTRSRFEYPSRVSVFSDAQRNGDFGEFPSNRWPKDPLTGEVFPDGRIPSSRILPQSRFYIDELIPRAAQGNELSGTAVDRPSGSQATSRIDHQFSPSDYLNVSLFINSGKWDWVDPGTIGSLWRYPDRGRNLSFQQTHSISSRAVNSFVFGWTYWEFEAEQESKFRNATLKDHGYNIHIQTSGPTGFPSVATDANYFSPAGGRLTDEITTYHWKDDFAWSMRSHALKFGAEIRWTGGTYFDSLYLRPYFRFSDSNPSGSGNGIADFLLGIPVSYSQGTDSSVQGRRLLSSLYLQDDLKLRANLTLNLGLRYELNGVLSDADGHNAAFRPGASSAVFPKAPAGVIFPGDRDPLTGRILGIGITPSDRNNFAPRFGIAYSPGFREGLAKRLFGGPGRTSIRGGYGIFYVLGRASAAFDLAYLPPWSYRVDNDRARMDVSGGNFANPWGKEPNPFPIDPTQRQFYLPLGGVPLVERSLRDAYQHQWTVSVQRELPRHIKVEIAYLGNTTLNLLRRFEGNPGLLTDGANLFNLNGRRTNKDFNYVRGYVGDGTSVYHGLQTSVSRRFASRFQLNGSYVWSKTLDDATGSFALGAADRDATPWGRANSDRRHNLVLYSVYELPEFRRVRVLDRILSGWQLTGILQIRSGLPFNLRNQFDSTLRGVDLGFPDITGPFREQNPRKIQTFRLPSGATITGNFFFDPTVFVTIRPNNVAEARMGNLGRNVFTGPGMNNVDMSLMRRIRLGERQRIEVRLDATNVFNHAQFRGLSPGEARSNSFFFGRALGTLGPRRIQFLLRYSF